MGIPVPKDRTINQPILGFCRNPECRTRDNKEFEFIVKHDDFECPNCGANQEPMIGMLVLTHLLIPDKKGPITGAGGLRYKIACNHKRAYLATTTNLEAATDNPKLSNCPECEKAIKKLGVKRATGKSLILSPEKK